MSSTTTDSARTWAAVRTSGGSGCCVRISPVWSCSWRKGTPGGTPNRFATVADALTEWAGAAVARRDTVITILDSRTYALPATITLTNENFLVIEAANGQRPLLQAEAGRT